jgi:hypothetical protein
MRFSRLILTMALAGATAMSMGEQQGRRSQMPRRTSDKQVTTIKIRIKIEGTAITATLAGNETSRDFVALLPLTLTLKDYGTTEKISDLPKKLSTKDAPPGYDPSVGDITYYAPWGNLALFHKDFGYSSGLVKLGTFRH